MGVRDAEEQVQGQHLPEGKEITQVNLLLSLLHPLGLKYAPLFGGLTHHLVWDLPSAQLSLALSVQAAQIERISFESHFAHWFFSYLHCHPLNIWAEQVVFCVSGILALLGFQGLFIWGY